MTFKSHHQSDFFRALNKRDDVDLKVLYISNTSQKRIEEGWKIDLSCMPYEKYVKDTSTIERIFSDVDDWRERIHIVPSHMDRKFVNYLVQSNAQWCHWSERPGIQLASLLRFNMRYFNWFEPFYILCKRKLNQNIYNSALGIFCQGQFAEHVYKRLGIHGYKINHLFYVKKSLNHHNQQKISSEIIAFLKERISFLYMGSLCKCKGIDILLRSFAQLPADKSCLVLCGFDRSGGRYEKLAEKLGILSRVRFLGAISSSDVANIYHACNVFVLPSRWDGWGVVLNEAASLGMPLVATDMCGAAWHLIEQRKNGFRVKNESVKSLKEAMMQYINYPALIKEHGDYSRDLFFREFTPERNALRLVNAIKKWKPRFLRS